MDGILPWFCLAGDRVFQVICDNSYFRNGEKRASFRNFYPQLKGETTTLLTYADIVEQIVGESGGSKPMTTTACYLCLCNGEETTTIEKDLVSAMIRPRSRVYSRHEQRRRFHNGYERHQRKEIATSCRCLSPRAHRRSQRPSSTAR